MKPKNFKEELYNVVSSGTLLLDYLEGFTCNFWPFTTQELQGNGYWN